MCTEERGRALFREITEGLYYIFLCLGVFSLTDMTSAQKHMSFISKHQQSIDSYIMDGYGYRNGRKCDVLSDNPQEEDSMEGRAQYVMNLNRIVHFDFSSNIVSLHCLLVSIEVNNNESLAALVNFGWRVVEHKRVAIMMKMSSSMTLNMLKNITKLPFLVAAELQDGREQFLCPVVGKSEPYLQHSMCDHAYTSPKNKVIRVGIVGVPPYLYGKTQVC